MADTYTLHLAGLTRELPICKVTDDLYIGAFIVFGDAELTVACARELLKLVPADSYDYMLTAEAKSIPLIHEMARQSGAAKYFIARKGPKAYMPDPLHVVDKSITTAEEQELYLGRDDADLIRGKRILLMDDVISTGGSPCHGGTGEDGRRHGCRPCGRSGGGRCPEAGRHPVPGAAAGVQCRRHRQRLRRKRTVLFERCVFYRGGRSRGGITGSFYR